MLEVRSLSVFYGQHMALRDVALRLDRSRIVVILGSNGAGKSTLLKALMGLVPTRSGAQVSLEGRSLLGLPTWQLVEAGIALVPEGRRLFGDMTVRENLLMGAYPKRAAKGAKDRLEFILSLFPRLGERLGQAVITMSGGEQQMVCFGRALMTAPKLLMLDEPSLGLSPLLTQELFSALPRIIASGVSVLMVEQNTHLTLRFADYGYVLKNGELVGQGTAAELQKDETVGKALLGI
ncbi:MULTISPECIES: ABC transporter ATP-binding protein [unclassified Bradyrhizobium]|uniref:ABC transporter ATP-binding protein n=1 Tax=unclassified Bradyrhizobium TaxID=2631580 RepID=UPI0024788267|nr:MULTISPECIES: ABC transporter ATP-binding protein [unclassified Bradyrhizobium]WGR73126.1 ABC transporter ATP-binding protein [Bradyrhizobium sp. ISRA426]WGR77966.1 ABC transporter ATP-binding protein [Bradyrhizobium sp. ISRA430]WGR88367.1 ABC transporter ATP-binding protein [Bradyrhizobium sp. ISRA432]